MDNYGAVKAVATKILGDIPFGSNPKDGVSDDKSLNQNIQMQEKEGENLPNKLSASTKETLLTSTHISMADPLYSNSPMEMDLLGGENKEIVDKEKMVSNGSKAIDFAISMETDWSEPILGKKKWKVQGSNSSKKDIERIRKQGNKKKEGKGQGVLKPSKSIPWRLWLIILERLVTLIYFLS